MPSLFWIFVFACLFILASIFVLKFITKRKATHIMKSRSTLVDDIEFEHFFLSNDGIFVAGVQYHKPMLILSALYSISGFLSIILAIVAAVSSNWIQVIALVSIAGSIFLSPIARWFPHKNPMICFKRAVGTYIYNYPHDQVVENLDTPLVGELAQKLLYDYYINALFVSQRYFFGDTNQN